MSGVVHFKFKSAISFDSVQFDGAFVSVGELKTLIAEKKGFGREATVELILSDPRSHAEYKDDAQLLPKSTSVLVRRTPAAKLRALEGSTEQQTGAPAAAGAAPAAQQVSAAPGFAAPQRLPLGPPRSIQDEFGGDLYTSQPASTSGTGEEDEIATRLATAGASWQKELAAASRGRGRGRGGRGRAGFNVPPPTYVCFRCNQTGHYISDCPTNGDPDYDKKRVRQPLGIPMSRLAANTEGGLVLPGGQVGSLMPNEEVFQREMFGTGASAQPAAAAAHEQQKPLPAQQAQPPTALPQATVQAPSDSPLRLPDKPHAEDAAGALVVYSAPPPAAAAPPALAGDDQLFEALAQPLAPAPAPASQEPARAQEPALAGGPPLPWGAPLPLPLMPPGAQHAEVLTAAFAPGLAAPLSKEAFERLRREALRGAARGSRSRSRSRSRSPSAGGRRRRRGDRSRARSSSGSGSSARAARRAPRRERRHATPPPLPPAEQRPFRRRLRESITPERRERLAPFGGGGGGRGRGGWRREPPWEAARQPPPKRLRTDPPVAHAPVGSMHSDSGGDPAERFEADMDRWEPGSDFESSKAAAPRAASRRAVPLANGAATHAPQPGRGRSAGGDVEGLPAPVASVDRLAPERLVQKPLAEPITLLEDAEHGSLDFGSQAAAPPPASADAAVDKQKKDKKEKKHKKHKHKHKKDKRHKKGAQDSGGEESADGLGDGDILQDVQNGSREPSGGGASHQQHPSTAGGTPVRANPRLFQRAMAAHAQPEEPRGEGRGRL